MYEGASQAVENAVRCLECCVADGVSAPVLAATPTSEQKGHATAVYTRVGIWVDDVDDMVVVNIYNNASEGVVQWRPTNTVDECTSVGELECCLCRAAMKAKKKAGTSRGRGQQKSSVTVAEKGYSLKNKHNSQTKGHYTALCTAGLDWSCRVDEIVQQSLQAKWPDHGERFKYKFAQFDDLPWTKSHSKLDVFAFDTF